MTKEEALSRRLAKVLRHTAASHQITLREDGFVPIQTLLDHRLFRGDTMEDIEAVVAADAKQRYAIREEAPLSDPSSTTRVKWIRANQGHSVKVEVELTPVTDPQQTVIHGTTMQAWSIIEKEGLSRMKRQHIHFAAGLPSDDQVISGMRSSSSVLIWIDVAKSMADGLSFYRSANGVILSPGNADGIIAPCYFARHEIRDRSTRRKQQNPSKRS
ncbi:hypothetical protein CXG81DRAFT_12874 [Caulochytrium protostelioides]|uniref:2'-phosphotransferase n=1 Tax=Caulochytrium protostelioides TaxID=1555241 RepID=A0A4P9WX57_9FUNG|nr:phosphotransferase KptA/Tpt1 [Caulochytrium protostelioides]RKP00752.1 hypothetical protein CXG81DRAFT_12874 [Caulochytrium protostelioides]|eukprot:RKP00752.1 hypothetical protein CXG81DRAFT_12874 [Caulochytrium protostelioides]